MLDQNGSPVAGICHARGMNVGLPPVWMLYLPVGDLVESIRRIEQEGGEVIKAVRGEDGKYVYAAVQDVVGAYLAFVQA
jgi:predicted enzyme related to lactoylglutathione lyase